MSGRSAKSFVEQSLGSDMNEEEAGSGAVPVSESESSVSRSQSEPAVARALSQDMEQLVEEIYGQLDAARAPAPHSHVEGAA